MPKYLVSRIVTEDWSAIIEAENEDEVYDIIAEGIEWEFIESNEEFEMEEQ
jgi:hypothetical protein